MHQNNGSGKNLRNSKANAWKQTRSLTFPRNKKNKVKMKNNKNKESGTPFMITEE